MSFEHVAPPQQPRTVAELLQAWMHADCSMVESFNRSHMDTPPTIEAELKFCQARQSNMGTALATLMRMLTEDSDGK